MCSRWPNSPAGPRMSDVSRAARTPRIVTPRAVPRRNAGRRRQHVPVSDCAHGRDLGGTVRLSPSVAAERSSRRAALSRAQVSPAGLGRNEPGRRTVGAVDMCQSPFLDTSATPRHPHATRACVTSSLAAMNTLPTLYKARNLPLKRPVCAICVDRTRRANGGGAARVPRDRLAVPWARGAGVSDQAGRERLRADALGGVAGQRLHDRRPAPGARRAPGQPCAVRPRAGGRGSYAWPKLRRRLEARSPPAPRRSTPQHVGDRLQRPVPHTPTARTLQPRHAERPLAHATAIVRRRLHSRAGWPSRRNAISTPSGPGDAAVRLPDRRPITPPDRRPARGRSGARTRRAAPGRARRARAWHRRKGPAPAH